MVMSLMRSVKLFGFGFLLLGLGFFGNIAKQEMGNTLSHTQYSWSVNSVYAQTVTEDDPITRGEADNLYQKKGDLSGIVDTMYSFLKIIYLILRPLLVVAGLAVDNTLVYGELFHLDAVLWQMWDMVRNFANFALVFVAFYHILKGLLKKDTKAIKSVVKNLLVAGILIQASWFLMGLVIDLSTITMYGVGGIPALTGQGEIQGKLLDRPVLGTKVHTKGKERFVYYTYGDRPPIAECYTVSYNSAHYAVGRKKFSLISDSSIPSPTTFANGMCIEGQEIYKFNDTLELNNNDSLENFDAYQNFVDTTFFSGGVFNTGHILEGYAVPLSYTLSGDVLKCGSEHDQKCGIVSHDDAFYTGAIAGLTIEKILNQSKGYVGSFVTLYASLLNFSDPNYNGLDLSNSHRGVFSEFLLKLLFALVLIIPLIVMTVVLILRVGILRLAIVFLPFLVLKWIFFNKDKDMFGKFIGDHYSIGNLISIIFAPVIMVFAVSISIVFMTAIMAPSGNSLSFDVNQFGVEMGKGSESKDLQDVNECTSYIKVLGLITVCNSEDSILNKAKDGFVDIIEKAFALAIMWFLLFAAIKTNSLGKQIGGAIQDVAQKALGTLPIIPLGKSGNIGFSTFKEQFVNGGAVSRVTSKQQEKDRKALQKLAPGIFGELPKGKISSELESEIAWSRARGENVDQIMKKYNKKFDELNMNRSDVNTLIGNIEQGSLTDESTVSESMMKEVGDGKSWEEVYANPKYASYLASQGYTGKFDEDKDHKRLENMLETNVFRSKVETLDDINKFKKDLIERKKKLENKNKEEKNDTDAEELEKIEQKIKYLEKQQKQGNKNDDA